MHLPSDLIETIRLSSIAIKILNLEARKMAEKSDFNQISKALGGEEPSPWRYEEGGFEDAELITFEKAPVAVMQHIFIPGLHPDDAPRRAETFVNSECCEMFGMHTDELLARVGMHDLPEHMCELDHLMTILENLFHANPSNGSYSQLIRVQFPGSYPCAV